MLFLLTVRARLLALIAAAILPLAGASIWSAISDASASREQAQGQLRLAATLVAAHQDRLADSAEHLLTAIAAMPDVRSLQRERCMGYFEALRGRYPLFGNIGIYNLQGDVICHAGGRQGGFNAADRDYFIDAARTGRLSMGEMVIGRSTRRPVLPFGLPVMEGGEVRAVAFATLDVGQMQAELGRMPLPEGVRLALADQQGRVLVERASTPPPEPGPGRLLDSAALRAAVQSLRQGEMRLPDDAGTDRLYALAPSAAVSGRQLVGIASVDAAMLSRQAWARALRQLGVALGVFLAGLLAAWLIGARMIAGPADQVLAVSRRLQQGDLSARMPLSRVGGRGELEQIAAALNQMADALQQRQLQLEAELRNSRSAHAVLDSILTNMREGVLAATASGQVLIHNAAAARIFPSADALTQPLRFFDVALHASEGGEPLAPAQLPLQRAMRGESGQMQMLARGANLASERLLHCSFQPLPLEAGDAAGVLVFSDVTELHLLQQDQARQLARARIDQRKLADAQRMGRIGHWEHELATGRIAWSDEVYALYGVGREEFDGTTQGLLSLAHPDDRARVASQLRSPAGGVDVEHRVLRRDGSTIWLRAMAELQLGEDGRQRLCGVVQDITALKRGESENARLLTELSELNLSLERRIEQRTAELAQQEARYRVLAEQAPEIIWNADLKGRATYFNRAMGALFGGKPEDWLGNAWMSRLHPDDLASVQAMWKAATENGQPFVGTRRCKVADGSWHTFHYRADPILDEQGQPVMWLGVDSDITELKSIESELRASNRELEAFSYSVSHDLRSPLAAIGGFARALGDRLAIHPDAKALHYLNRITAGANLMEQQIEGLLSLTRTVRQPMEWGLVDLSSLALDALEGLHMQQPHRLVTVTVQEGMVTRGDARLIRTVMQNLLGNAWKFTARRDEAVIEVGCVDQGERVYFVRDNGAGFDMAHAGKLFGPFQRLHSQSDYPGTGIGLASVQRVITRHQGRIWAEAVRGEGCTIWFTLGESAPMAALRAGETASAG